VLIELAPAQLQSGTTELTVGVYSEGKRLQTLKTGFIGPRKDA